MGIEVLLRMSMRLGHECREATGFFCWFFWCGFWRGFLGGLERVGREMGMGRNFFDCELGSSDGEWSSDDAGVCGVVSLGSLASFLALRYALSERYPWVFVVIFSHVFSPKSCVYLIPYAIPPISSAMSPCDSSTCGGEAAGVTEIPSSHMHMMKVSGIGSNVIY